MCENKNNNKQKLGQFFTTNVDYILCEFEKYILNKNIQDPFCGNKDLLRWAINNKAKSIKGYDIDIKYVDNKISFYNDSLQNRLKYDFVLTNPPYLYINKSNEKYLFTHNHTDLYQVSIESILDSKEGILIVPINFLSAENSKYIRNMFFEKFQIVKAKYFSKQVFNDTTYNVMAFYYKKKESNIDLNSFILNIQPDNIDKFITIYKKFDWQIGGEFIDKIMKQQNSLNIKRLLEKDIIFGDNNLICAYNHLNIIKNIRVDKTLSEKIKNNIILLKAIDTGSKNGLICLEDIRKYNLDCLVSLETSRNQIYLLFGNQISVEEQMKLINLFNNELNYNRKKYYSLFMTNFRDNNRKRISFNFAYGLINYLYFNKIKKENYDIE